MTATDAIAFDVTPAINGTTGIARYVLELSDALERQPDARPLLRFAIGRAAEPVPRRTHHVRVPQRIVGAAWHHVRLPHIERMVGACQTVHASGAAMPASAVPVVAVVYDLAALDHPELHPPRQVRQLRRYLDDLDRAEIVLSISHATADRLAGRGVAADRIRVVPVGHRLTAGDHRGAAPFDGARYILAVGAPVPRKRFDRLVRALPTLPDDVRLVVVGPTGSDDDALAAAAQQHRVGERYVRTGGVTDAELDSWYRHASVVAMPSVEEGFGFPVVEALAAGTPVVASDIEVFREVSGGGALLVPVDDDAAFVDALASTLAGGAEVAALTARGRAHVAQYTWDACAAATLRAHRDVS